MRHPLLAAVLLVVWLVATQHCGLEAAGLMESHATESACCAGGEDHCSHDGCQIVEDSGYAPGQVLKAPAPHFVDCLHQVGSLDLFPPREVDGKRGQGGKLDPPLDWLPTWQFVQRAAPEPRAPSLDFS